MVRVKRRNIYVPTLTDRYTACRYCEDDSLCTCIRYDYYYVGNLIDNFAKMVRYIRNCSQKEFEESMKDKKFRTKFLQNEITQVQLVKNPKLRNVKIKVILCDHMKRVGGVYINTYISKKIDKSRYEVIVRLDERILHRREEFRVVEDMIDESIIEKYC